MFLPAFVGRKKVPRPHSRQRRLLSYGVSYKGECTKVVKESTEDAEPSHFSNSGGRVLERNWAVIIPIVLCIFRDLDKANYSLLSTAPAGR